MNDSLEQITFLLYTRVFVQIEDWNFDDSQNLPSSSLPIYQRIYIQKYNEGVLDKVICKKHNNAKTSNLDKNVHCI